jgi:hypothetical protein
MGVTVITPPAEDAEMTFFRGSLVAGSGVTVVLMALAISTESYTSVSQTTLSHTATVAGPVTPGDVLVTTINRFSIRYTVASDDTPSTIAANIALAINDTATPDPFSGLSLNMLVVASSQAEVIAIDAVNAGAPFRLNCSMPPPTGTYATAAAATVFWTATVVGSPRASVTYQTVINGVEVSYPVEGSLDEDAIAAGIADTINVTSALDPITQLPLNTVVRASSSGGVVTITPDPAAYPTCAISRSTASCPGGRRNQL